jgi:hypothetical protein
VKAGDLASEVIHDAQRLASLEIALAKREVKDIAVANGIATGLVVAGGLLIMLAVLVAVPVTVVLLVPWHWLLAGKAKFQLMLPRRTIESLKESKEWALRRIRSNGR